MKLLLALGVIAAVLFVAWRALLQAGRRREALRAYANARGFRFLADRGPLPSDLRDFPPFKQGSNRYGYNFLTGDWEASAGVWTRLHAGDYHYQVTRSNGKNTSTTHYHLSYVAIHLPDGPAPRVAVRRENFLDTISAAIGFDDIDFESAEFSRKFHVSSDDKRFAYDLLHPRTMEMLLARCPKRLDLGGPWLLVTDGARQWKHEEFDDWLAWTREFLGLWPRHLSAPSPTAGESTLP